MYKLISIDLDETLLDYKKDISRENLDAINKAREQGCYICVNTVRNYISCIDICRYIHADFVIYLNGCYVKDLRNDKFIRNRFLSALHFFFFYAFPYRFVADKYYGLRKLVKYLSLSMSDVVSIGDSVYDLLAIQKSGLGVFVANSDAKLKLLCDYSTNSTNDHSAVADAIYYALNEESP